MFDLGIDVGFLNNSLNITADFFNNVTRDILIGLPVPGMFGGGSPVQNAGKVRNRGWELNMNYRFKTGQVEHFVSGNVSDAANEVIDTRGVEWINVLMLIQLSKKDILLILIMLIELTVYSKMMKRLHRDLGWMG